jgi:hypothetical protein
VLELNTWDSLIREMAYGSPDATATSVHWWTTNVVIPCQSSAGMNLVTRLEGSQTMPASFQSSSSKRGASSKAGGAPASKKSGAPCRDWNNGSCRDPCPNGYRHVCGACGLSNHRQPECQKGKGNGGGNKKSKHSNKNKGDKGKAKGSKGKSPM